MFERIVRSSYLSAWAKVIEITSIDPSSSSVYVETYFMYKKCLEMSEIRFLEMQFNTHSVKFYDFAIFF